MGSVLAELERLSAYSSFYTGVAARGRLELIGKLGLADAEMERRLALVQQRFGG
ncbi:MAG: hypothetical protein FJ095_10895 [Deltaproteobacteria bacterium]|nr:hypothetical protein [Deltaproteobacteria bacterium]